MTSKSEGIVRAPVRERAVLVLPDLHGGAVRHDGLRESETAGLIEALDLERVDTVTPSIRRVDAATFLGSGKVTAIAAQAEAAGASVVVVDAGLSPVQQRNLERALKLKVIDRTGLILEIFARRARTKEGALQVELARLAYERSRLVRTWTHLDRQRGGLGKTGGPGETQLELDRRQIAERMKGLEADLEDVRRTRGLQRRARRRAGLPSVALVGYTNAGKSSLFNLLTDAGVLAKDMPFATLDPTARRVRLPSGRAVAMNDTVGFITDLPHELIAAFRATLEEVIEADVIVHVRDIAHPETERQKADVLTVLAQLQDGAGFRQPMLEAWNKIDLLAPEQRDARTGRATAGEAPAVAISARSGAGVADLLAAIDALAFGPVRQVTARIDPADGKLRAWIASQGRVLSERLEDDSLAITVEAPERLAAQLDEAVLAAR